MTSGYNEEWNFKLLNLNSTETNFLHDSLDMDSTLLLFVVIGLCAVIILLLGCILCFVCKKKIKTTSLSKATSVTGLNEKVPISNDNDVSVEKLTSTDTDTNTNCNITAVKFHKPRKNAVVTSTPADAKVLGAQMNSNDNDKARQNVFNLMLSDNSSFNHSQHPCESSIDVGDWATALSTQGLSSIDTSSKSSIKHSQQLVNGVKVVSDTNDHLPYKSEHPEVVASESASLLSDNKTASSSSSHNHPQAWFVPLGKMSHEPIRHSYIDVSRHKDNCSKESVREPLIQSITSEDFEKLSAWEQREDRPVLFLKD